MHSLRQSILLRNNIQLLILLNLASSNYGWQYFTSLKDIVLMDSQPDTEHIHSEYRYGDKLCRRPDKVLLEHVHLDHMEVLGKIIIRGWLNLNRIPTCIVIRGFAYEEDMFRSTSYNFQICVPRITYCHSKRRYKYFYYEWYIPYDMIGGMNWEIYFYGDPNPSWT